MATPCYVYMIVAEDAPVSHENQSLFKVGISDNPYGRMANFQTANPYRLALHGTWRLPSRQIAQSIERAFHLSHAKCQMVGEWFMDATRLARFELEYELATQLAEDHGFGKSFELEDALIRAGVDEERAYRLRVSMYGEEYNRQRVEDRRRKQEEEILDLYLEALGLE